MPFLEFWGPLMYEPVDKPILCDLRKTSEPRTNPCCLIVSFPLFLQACHQLLCLYGPQIALIPGIPPGSTRSPPHQSVRNTVAVSSCCLWCICTGETSVLKDWFWDMKDWFYINSCLCRMSMPISNVLPVTFQMCTMLHLPQVPWMCIHFASARLDDC